MSMNEKIELVVRLMLCGAGLVLLAYPLTYVVSRAWYSAKLTTIGQFIRKDMRGDPCRESPDSNTDPRPSKG